MLFSSKPQLRRSVVKMEVKSVFIFCFLVCISCLRGATSKPGEATSTETYKVVCYLGSWANYRNGEGKFTIEDIDPFLCTHLIYGFAKLDSNNNIAVYDPYLDLKENWGLGAFERFNNLKQRNPELKTLLAIGGWNEGSVKYSNMVKTAESRRVFVESCVQMLTKHKFDGLDLDWEYPANRGGIAEDKANFVLLIRELREAFKPLNLLVTAAVSAGQQTIDSAYDVPALAKYLDFINLMTYDFHGAWDTTTGHNAPLYPRPNDSDNNKKLTVDYAVQYWLKKGAPSKKLVLGMPLYGRSFTLQNPKQHDIGAPVTGAGIAGRFTGEQGMIGFNEICDLLRGKSSWTIVFDPFYKAPYMYQDRKWIGYDDIESIAYKVDYIKKMELAGGMVWSIETDDFGGNCEGYPYPLLTTIRNGLNGKLPKPPSSTSKPIASSTAVIFSPTTESKTTKKGSTAGPDRMGNSCIGKGYFRDLENCTKFYLCVPKIVSGKVEYDRYEYNCAPGTVFSEKIQACSFLRDVPECNIKK